jgi:hypothetical protein
MNGEVEYREFLEEDFLIIRESPLLPFLSVRGIFS